MKGQKQLVAGVYNAQGQNRKDTTMVVDCPTQLICTWIFIC